MNLVRRLASGCRLGTLQLGQLHCGPGFDLIEKPFQARVVSLLPLIPHGPNEPIEGAGGHASIQNGQLEFIQNIQDATSPSQRLLATLEGTRGFLQGQKCIQ